MNGKTFTEALNLMKKGKVPNNVEEVRAYAQQWSDDRTRAIDAMFECLVRLNNDNMMLRSLCADMKETNKRYALQIGELRLKLNEGDGGCKN